VSVPAFLGDRPSESAEEIGQWSNQIIPLTSMDSNGDTRTQKALSNIMSISTALRTLVASHINTPLITPTRSLSCLPHFPPPPDILPELEMSGAPVAYIQQLHDAYMHGCLLLKQRTETSMASLPHPSNAELQTFQAIYFKRIDNMKNRLLQRFHDTLSKIPPRSRFLKVREPICLGGGPYTFLEAYSTT